MAKRGGGGHLQIKMCYFIHLKNTGKKLLTQGKHREFHLNPSVATLVMD